jgi:hypothetical protein
VIDAQKLLFKVLRLHQFKNLLHYKLEALDLTKSLS